MERHSPRRAALAAQPRQTQATADVPARRNPPFILYACGGLRRTEISCSFTVLIIMCANPP
jgi:hypothetical protein